MSTLVALHDKVILKKIESEDRIEGGIIIPDTGKERSNLFEVVNVGPGMYNQYLGNYIPMEVQVGDQVIVPKAVVTQVINDGDEYYICREVEIQSVIKD
jgi:chaperonin GroES